MQPHILSIFFQSGSGFSNFAFQSDREKEKRQAQDIGLELGCPSSTSSALIACLKQVDVRQLRLTADLVGIVQFFGYITLELKILEKNLYIGPTHFSKDHCDIVNFWY